MKLTERRKDVCRTIFGFKTLHGFNPSIQDLCTALGVSSTYGVRKHLSILRDGGYVSFQDGLCRTIQLTETGRAIL